jgi:hypothetical protein
VLNSKGSWERRWNWVNCINAEQQQAAEAEAEAEARKKGVDEKVSTHLRRADSESIF